MAALFKNIFGGLFPKAPRMPALPTLPEAPNREADDEAMRERSAKARAQQKKRASGALGRKSTILTGSRGLEGEPSTQRATLLGM